MREDYLRIIACPVVVPTKSVHQDMHSCESFSIYLAYHIPLDIFSAGLLSGSYGGPVCHLCPGFWDHYRPKPRAVVIGGGFIGLEMVENLVPRGFEVTLVEMLDQVLPMIDPEHARVVEAYLKRHGVRLALNDGVAGFKQAANGAIDVETKSGKT